MARIKKMMQSDEDVGKIATVTPVLVAKALECMMEYLLKEACHVAVQRRTKTVTPQHLKMCVTNNDSFDFLRDVFKDIQLADAKPLSPDAETGRKRRDRTSTTPSATPRKRPRSPASPTEEPKVRRKPANESHNPSAVRVAEAKASLPPLKQPAAIASPPVPLSVVNDEEDDEDYDDDDMDDATPPGPRTAERVSVQALLS